MKRLLLFAVVAGCGPQPEHPEVAEVLLQRADLDGSGEVDRAEFEQLAFPSEGFAPYDLDSDGGLDAYELERAFLTASPSDFQDEGRIEVHRKYGHPFERPGGNVRGKGPRGKGPRGKGPRGRGPRGKHPEGQHPRGKAPPPAGGPPPDGAPPGPGPG